MLTRARIRRGGSLVAIAFATTLVAGQAHAAAFYLQEQSVKAEGRAFSGEVSERGAQQMWWNPAAIGGIAGMQSYVGVTAILPRSTATDDGTLIARPGIGPIPGLLPRIPASVSGVGGDPSEHNPVNNGYLPNGGFAIPLGDKLAFGFTATSPYSFTTNYSNDSWARYSADKTRLRTYDLQPVLAFSPVPSISIGAGPNVEYVRATFSNYLPDPLPAAAGYSDGHQYLKGDGWDVGYSLGFQFHNDKVDIGASYKSKITHKLKGKLIVDGLNDPLLLAAGANQVDEGAQAKFTTPWQVNVGMRYHVTPQFTLNGQITRFGWDEFSQIALSNLGTGPDQAIPEKYKNTFSYALGFDYALSPQLTVRGGVQRDLSPIIDGERDPRVPDGSRWNFAVGASYELTQRFGFDLAASYDKIHSEKIDKITAAYVGTPLQTAILTSGTSSNARALVFGLGAHMGF